MSPRPTDDSQRVRALREYRLLDTPPEEAFDDFTRLASHLLRAPIALVVFLDEKRQWFKSRVGIGATETPIGDAFCAHTVAARGTFVVEDAAADERFAANPLVTGEPHVRFYMGAPLMVRGLALGTLCAIDRSPRRADPSQVAMLEALARQVGTLIEYRRVAAELSQALESVRVLRGLVPVCAWCKSVRDDEGYWGRVEDYLQKSAGVATTHGMCPECLEKQLDDTAVL